MLVGAVTQTEGNEVAAEAVIYSHSSIVCDNNQTLVFRPGAALDCTLVPVDAVDQLARACVEVDRGASSLGAAVGVEFRVIAVESYLSGTVSAVLVVV
jgi:hypothetical protein